jgi:hypothetical protein
MSSVSWLRWLEADLPPRRAGFALGSVLMGVLANKVALGQDFLLVLSPLTASFICGSSYTYTTQGMNINFVRGRSSETQSHPIDMNNINIECLS